MIYDVQRKHCFNHGFLPAAGGEKRIEITLIKIKSVFFGGSQNILSFFKKVLEIFAEI